MIKTRYQIKRLKIKMRGSGHNELSLHGRVDVTAEEIGSRYRGRGKNIRDLTGAGDNLALVYGCGQ